MSERVRIGELRLNGSATIAGRVVAQLSAQLGERSRAFVLRDGTGEMRVVGPEGASPPIGALVVVTGECAKSGFLATRVEIVGLPALRGGETGDWSDPASASKRRELVARDHLLRSLRGWFAEHGFLEVETPTLLAAPGQEPHLLPFATAFHGRDGARPLWLATSPEYAMKRLLALGFERLFQLGRSYRDGRDEQSPLHAPEFTMVEWYRAWDGLAAIGADVAALLRTTATALRGTPQIERSGRRCDLARPPRWLTVERAFTELAAIELSPYLDGDDAAFVASLPTTLPRVGESAREQADSAYFRLLVERIEPQLGIGEPTLLCRYPARHAALSELAADDPRVAERFEAYVVGIELCNAFQELRDPEEQERRLRAEQEERVRAGGERLPLSEPFLRALRSGLPPCAGVALGVDRLHLLLTGAAQLSDVQPFSFGE